MEGNRQGSLALPDLVIHIGAPKSGSSAIQRFCHAHRETLASFGYWYPDHPQDPNGVSGGHTQLSVALMQGNEDQARQRLAEWLAEARKRDMCLLLSAEIFYARCAMMRRITDGLQVQVVGFLRHPVDFLLGNHNQGIKRHFGTRRLDSLLAGALNRRNDHQVGKPFLEWADAYGDGNCAFMPYKSPTQGGAAIERRFLQTLGLSEAQAGALVGETEIVNRSYVKSALELKRLLNTLLSDLPKSAARHVDWSLQDYSDRAVDEHGCTMADVSWEMREMLTDHVLEQLAPVVERFPELREVATGPESPAEQGADTWLDLGSPLKALAEDEPQVLAQIREAAVAQRDAGRSDYAFYKLLEVLGIPFDEPEFCRQLLTPAARKTLANNNAGGADYLREMALMLERLNFLDDALMVIDRALDKRPSGKVIKRIKTRIERKLDSHRASGETTVKSAS